MRRHTCSRPARGGRVVNGGAWLEIDGSVVDRSTATFTRYAAGQRLPSTDAWPTRRRATWCGSRKYLGVIDSDLYKRRRRWKRRATCRLSGPAAGAAASRRTTSPTRARRRDVVPPPRRPSPASTEPIVVHPRRPATPASWGDTAGSVEEHPDFFGESAPAGNSRAKRSGSGGGLVVSAAGRGPSASTTSGGSAWGRGLRGSTGARG